jgi:hypothetical protein
MKVSLLIQMPKMLNSVIYKECVFVLKSIHALYLKAPASAGASLSQFHFAITASSKQYLAVG